MQDTADYEDDEYVDDKFEDALSPFNTVTDAPQPPHSTEAEHALFAVGSSPAQHRVILPEPQHIGAQQHAVTTRTHTRTHRGFTGKSEEEDLEDFRDANGGDRDTNNDSSFRSAAAISSKFSALPLKLKSEAKSSSLAIMPPEEDGDTVMSVYEVQSSLRQEPLVVSDQLGLKQRPGRGGASGLELRANSKFVSQTDSKFASQTDIDSPSDSHDHYALPPLPLSPSSPADEKYANHSIERKGERKTTATATASVPNAAFSVLPVYTYGMRTTAIISSHVSTTAIIASLNLLTVAIISSHISTAAIIQQLALTYRI